MIRVILRFELYFNEWTSLGKDTNYLPNGYGIYSGFGVIVLGIYIYTYFRHHNIYRALTFGVGCGFCASVCFAFQWSQHRKRKENQFPLRNSKENPKGKLICKLNSSIKFFLLKFSHNCQHTYRGRELKRLYWLGRALEQAQKNSSREQCQLRVVTRHCDVECIHSLFRLRVETLWSLGNGCYIATRWGWSKMYLKLEFMRCVYVTLRTRKEERECSNKCIIHSTYILIDSINIVVQWWLIHKYIKIVSLL